MVRQDKITFLISTLRTPELYAPLLVDDFVHERSFSINNSIDRVLKRIGIVRKREEKQVEILTKYIPVNKHQFLKKALIQTLKLLMNLRALKLAKNQTMLLELSVVDLILIKSLRNG